MIKDMIRIITTIGGTRPSCWMRPIEKCAGSRTYILGQLIYIVSIRYLTRVHWIFEWTVNLWLSLDYSRCDIVPPSYNEFNAVSYFLQVMSSSWYIEHPLCSMIIPKFYTTCWFEHLSLQNRVRNFCRNTFVGLRIQNNY